MKTKLTALLMAALFFLTVPALALSDIDDHWANSQILTLVHFGYVSGYPDGTFQPDKNITRAEAVTILGHMVEDGGYDDEPIPFTDIDGSWAKQNIEKLQAFGIVSGYEDGTFRPDKTITRAEFCVMYYHVMLWNEELELGGPEKEMVFTDLHEFSEWMMEAVEVLHYISYISGYPDGSFRPNGYITRAEASAIIAKRHLSDDGDPDPVDPDPVDPDPVDPEPGAKKDFGDMSDADRQKIDALLLALGADESYEVVNQSENFYEIFLPNFSDTVTVTYNPGEAEPFEIFISQAIVFDVDGHKFTDYLIPYETKLTWMEWTSDYFENADFETSDSFTFYAYYAYDFETDSIDSSLLNIYVEFDNGDIYYLVVGTDGTLISIEDWSEGVG